MPIPIKIHYNDELVARVILMKIPCDEFIIRFTNAKDSKTRDKIRDDFKRVQKMLDNNEI